MTSSSRLRLYDAYLIEGLNAFACTIVGSCIYFWTRSRYGYSDTENLLMGSLQGLVYVLAPHVGGRLGDRFGHDRLVVLGSIGMLLAEIILLAAQARWLPFLALPFFIGAMSLTWPSLEATVVLQPGRLSTPDRLGLYNVIWACVGAAGFFSAGALFRFAPDAILIAALLTHVIQMAWLLFPRRPHAALPAGEQRPHRGDHTPKPVKRRFKQLGWLGNGLGYLMQGGLVALAPTLGQNLGLPPSSAIWLICAFFAARAVAFALFWRFPGWHYRLPAILAALAAGPCALAVIFAANRLELLLAALVMFGASIGFCYYSSIYYSLDSGEEKGAHGGWHESIIGLGGLVGPAAGVAGSFAIPHAAGAPIAIVAVAGVFTAAGCGLILRRLRN